MVWISLILFSFFKSNILTHKFHTYNNIKTLLKIACIGNLIPLLRVINRAVGFASDRWWIQKFDFSGVLQTGITSPAFYIHVFWWYKIWYMNQSSPEGAKEGMDMIHKSSWYWPVTGRQYSINIVCIITAELSNQTEKELILWVLKAK